MNVFIVTKNADFTEGRGPMMFHKAFATFGAAEAYVMSQDGIYGSKQGKSSYGGYNGYDIKEAPVLDRWDAEEFNAKKEELRTLEQRVHDLQRELRQ
jgi:hypothetical protein